jgi:3'(2'), 5'-bisphosphate nucleotidase
VKGSRVQPEEYLTPSVAKAIAQIAADAGRAIMEIYEQPEAWNVEVKGDASPLTQADLRANDIIVAALASLAPEVPVLSEESPWTGGDVATYWAVDPLDGTKEFLKRNGEFTVNIALVVEGVTRMGVICAPALKTLWVGVVQGASAVGHTHWAARAQLATLDPQSVAACTWEQISVSRSAVQLADERSIAHSSASTVPAMSAPPLRMVVSRSHGSNDYPAWVAPLVTVATMIERGSSLKFCLIAQGDADMYVRMGPTCIWDTAAGHAILVAAGGHVVHAQTREEVTYPDPQRVLNPQFLVYVPGYSF